MATGAISRKSRIQRIGSWFRQPVRLARGPAGDPSHVEDLSRAIATNLSQRLPLAFSLLIVDLAVLSIRFSGSASLWLARVIPLLICAAAFWRAIYWLPHNVRERSSDRIRRDLERITLVGSLFAGASACWALTLYSQGDQTQQSLVHYVVIVTCFTSVLSLAHWPRAATLVACLVMIPSSLAFLLYGHPNGLAVSLIQLVATLLLLSVTMNHHRDFVRLELSRRRAARREREAARLAEVNHYNATVDPLTGALNRRAVLARLEQGIADANEPAPWLALLDLDGFKHVNDTYGHAAGDTVLRTVSDRIESMRGLTAFGRLGGDEFAILLDGRLGVETVCTALQGLSEAVRLPIEHNGMTLRLAASIGLRQATFSTVGECLERSDAALYKAKEKGDGAVVLFTAEDERELTRRSAATRRFNDCPLEDRLRLVYQPIVDIDANQVICVEAFARWSPDGENWLAPSHFLSLAQATGRTGELTRLVLARALAECRAWEFGRDVAINLSPRDVMRDGTPDVLAALVREAEAPPERILLEVTERALHQDPRRAGEQLAVFRKLGFRIALDDFGAGWSSLSHVRNLPLDRLKIDRGLASALADDAGARAIAGTIVGLAWQMGLECTIEGIENERQAEIARALGLRIMQGYHFGRPQSAVDMLVSLEQAA